MGINGGCYSGLETQVLFNKGSMVVTIQHLKRKYCSIGVNGRCTFNKLLEIGGIALFEWNGTVKEGGNNLIYSR